MIKRPIRCAQLFGFISHIHTMLLTTKKLQHFYIVYLAAATASSFNFLLFVHGFSEHLWTATSWPPNFRLSTHKGSWLVTESNKISRLTRNSFHSRCPSWKAERSWCCWTERAKKWGCTHTIWSFTESFHQLCDLQTSCGCFPAHLSHPGHAAPEPFCFPFLALSATMSSPHCRPDFTEMFENRTRSTSSGASDKRRRREQRVARRGDVQTGNVTGGGRRAKKHLFFYSSRESLSALIMWNGTEASAARARACVFFTYAPGTCRSTESRGKLCLGAGSELLKQSSADKHRVLSSWERTRA